MTIASALRGVVKIGLDASPIIYYFDPQSPFHARCVPFFDAIAKGRLQAVTPTLTLVETLVSPIRTGDAALAAVIRDLLLNADIVAESLTPAIAERAASLRATYNLRTPDAVQVATAIETGYDAFLTNDAALKRVVETRVIVVSELTA